MQIICPQTILPERTVLILNKCSCTPPRTPEWAFRRLMHAHHTAHAAVFDRLGLKQVGQPMILFELAKAKEEERRLTQRDLADQLRRSPSTITISINSLEKLGYIRRLADEKDKRRNYVEISDEGLLIAEKCRTAFDDLDRAMFEGLIPEQKDALTDLFNNISANLYSLADGESEESKT